MKSELPAWLDDDDDDILINGLPYMHVSLTMSLSGINNDESPLLFTS